MKHVLHYATSFRGRVAVSVALAVCTVALGSGLANANDFAQTNLVSDVSNLALHQDLVLKNAWGLSHGPNTPFWVSDAGTDLSTLYDGTGSKVPLQVAIPGPPAHGPAVPTGNLFNPTSGFLVTPGDPSTKAFFIFAGATGTISAWNPNVDRFHAILKVDNFPQASYTGIALGTNSAGTFLFAANFPQGRIDVFDSTFASATLAGTFTDPIVPTGFGPFNIENINGMLFVTYAKINPQTGRDVAGVGNGYVAVFDTNGMLVRHFASQGLLNSPWGMAVAPSTFENVKGDLLVGNFGDGHINAFRLSDGRFRGQLRMDGQPIVIPGLWSLVDGGDALHADPNAVYFTAGINHEADGLFGTLGVPADETGSEKVTGLPTSKCRCARSIL
jgi:uncharacterized protein (TIGR03118 family)